MSRVNKIRGIATNILGAFVSRNNDVNGYWAIGKLYDAARQCQTEMVVVDLLSATIEPKEFESDFKRMLNRYTSMLVTHLGKYRLPADSLAKVTIRLCFDSAVTDTRPPTYLPGQPYRCTIELEDSDEHLLSVSHVGVARPHDPLRESRSTRG